MLKSLATILRNAVSGPVRKKPVGVDPVEDDTGPIFEGLAMTDELREALFPKQTQMVSAIFDRAAPLDRPVAQTPVRSEATREFPIIF